ncbi:hypothetical protein EJ05DRAFT_514744 [Pseudovirgaria hyperparasitica]|uniref:E3 ubiquitin-protein ligase listerin n=1 Tax=Pseudovirgaria hyperparasitica TaxID=470096 RepID=A0A6A6VX30_9PEZI|nr:uncharacterized protein EJ05DRAFT_514744 [Pseudovirgaria hyperparasitica]KAF2753817.1 hypothetical protein EJ05DRAFT_514744 [Pseudovirgaria hyperparasitica]
MSKRQFKSQASSSRAANAGFGGGFGASSFATAYSPLSYVTEPPNLSGISNANLVVSFKNLSKKDSTTKAKALEELQAYVASGEEIEDAALEAWIKLYPRTSIENSRRVRQLAHTVQGQISTACGKRIARYMPEAVGAWLSGLYDNDLSVTKAAQESFSQVFTTPEKLRNVRKAFQGPTIEYCRNVIENETVVTLSDERTVSPDDAESKYARVVSAAIGVIGDLLNELSEEDTKKQQEQYDAVLSNEKLWDLISHKDSHVRRSTLRLLRTCQSKQPNIVSQNLKHLSKCLLSHGLGSDQTGSALNYIGAVITMSRAYPTIWTEQYSGKKSAEHRLRSFLKRGSQMGTREYWNAIPDFLEAVPQAVLPKTPADVKDLLSSIHSGIIKKDEPRMNIGSAYEAYVRSAVRITAALDSADQETILQEMVLPLVSQYVNPTPDSVEWAIPGPQAASVISKITEQAPMSEILNRHWPVITRELVDAIKASAPEQSKEYERSQDAVSDWARRWATVHAGCLKGSNSSALFDGFKSTAVGLVRESTALLKSRNGKPYCAAAAIAYLLRFSSHVARKDILQELDNFIAEDLPSLVLSPSSSHLIAILYLAKDSSQFAKAWKSTVETITADAESPSNASAIEELLSSSDMPPDFALATSDTNLQNFISGRLKTILRSDTDWAPFGRILRQARRLLAPSTTEEMLIEMTKGLSMRDTSLGALHAIDQVARQSPAMLREFVPTGEGTNLLRSLLLLGESADEHVAQEASSVSASIQALLTQDSSDPSSKNAVFDVIQSGLSEATSTSVTVETLVELATTVLSDESSKNEAIVSKLFPPVDVWKAALQPFLNIAPRAPFAVTNSLCGTVYLVRGSSSNDVKSQEAQRDINGFSSAYRIAAYLVGLLQVPDLLDFVSPEGKAALFGLLQLTVLLANDNLSIVGSNNLWNVYTAEIEADALEFVSAAQALINGWLQKSSDWWADDTMVTDYSFVHSALENFLQASTGSSPAALYNGSAYSIVTAELIELHGWQMKKTDTIETTWKSFRKSENAIRTAAYLTGYRTPLASSKVVERACNEIVADLTGLELENKLEETMVQLNLLNLMLQHLDGMTIRIAKQRVIFLIKHILPWLQDDKLPVLLQSEICRALSALLPAMKDMYGSHWTETLAYITGCWSKVEQIDSQDGQESNIPVVHSTLKLYATLQALSKDEDPNDDLLDALKDAEDDEARGLINLLKNSQHIPDDFHQPLRVVNQLLARRISTLSLKHIDDPSELYPLLYVQSSPVQKTAWDILHKHIPAAQEQISLDAALDKKDAKLPDELLSLILEAPTTTALADADFERSIPLPLRGYLLSWLLIFDHFPTASHKVRTDYTEHLKTDGSLTALLDLTVSFLGHTRGKPTDISALNITTYTPDTTDPPTRDAQHLLSHLYYLALTHLPGPTKTWFIALPSRQTSLALSTWTERFVSPPVIAAALADVIAWASAQSTTTPDPAEHLAVKVSPRARELSASYTLDDQPLSIRIALPPTFPLAPATVEGLARVAVTQARWEAWLRSTAGVIAFGGGSVVDGLIAFRRNVVGVLKGHVECAICYSVVGPDRSVPGKRCGTCRNAYHGQCLFRWFKSSGGSACPLCRNAFNYG